MSKTCDREERHGGLADAPATVGASAAAPAPVPAGTLAAAPAAAAAVHEEAAFAQLWRAIEEAGFDCFGEVDAAALEVRDEVRDMCASGVCHQYGRNWACPPACGDLDVFRLIIGSCSRGIVFQTVGVLEDEFDGEAMMDAEALHKRRTEALSDALAAAGLGAERCLVLSAGTCTRCKPCAYPEPCRFPGRRLVSMEAAGLLVTDACNAAGVPYNHGRLTIAYTGCALLCGSSPSDAAEPSSRV